MKTKYLTFGSALALALLTPESCALHTEANSATQTLVGAAAQVDASKKLYYGKRFTRPTHRPSRPSHQYKQPTWPGYRRMNYRRRGIIRRDHRPKEKCQYITAPIGYQHFIHDDLTYTVEEPEELLGTAYEAQSPYCKEEQIWKKVIFDRETQGYFHGDEFKSTFGSDFKISFDNHSDTMTKGRQKKTHPVGVTMKIKMIITNRNFGYTGLWDTGAYHGIGRVSEFADTHPDETLTTPGIAIKFFRQGCSSANGFFMADFLGIKSFNFFKEPWSNVIDIPVKNGCVHQSLARKMMESETVHIGAMSILDFAKRTLNCKVIDDADVKAPWQVRLLGNDIHNWPDEYENEFYNQFMLLPKSFKMLTIEAKECAECPFVKIGFIVTKSRPTTSRWGDEKLFFRHERLEDHVKLVPELKDFVKKATSENVKLEETGGVAIVDPQPGGACPFSYFFDELKINLGITESTPSHEIARLERNNLADWGFTPADLLLDFWRFSSNDEL